MNTRAVKSLVVLLLTAALLCTAGTAFACCNDDPCHSPEADVSHHCATHCSCHVVGLNVREPNLGSRESIPDVVPAVEEARLPLVVCSILLPPIL